MTPGGARKVVLAALALALAGLARPPAVADDLPDRAAWERALDEHAALPDAAAALAWVERTEADLRDRLAKAPSPELRLRLAELLLRGKLPRLEFLAQGAAASDALALLEAVVAEAPDRVDARYLLARACLSMPPFLGKRDRGLALVEDLVARADAKPGTVPYPDVFLLAARSRRDAGDVTAALAAVEVGLRSFPDDERLRAGRETLRKALAGGGGPAAPPAPSPQASPPSAADAGADAAYASLRSALEAGRLDYVPLADALAAAAKAGPTSARVRVAEGLLRLWLLETPDAEPSRRSAAVVEAIERFRLATALDRDDTRIDGWLGSLLYVAGRRSGAPDLVREGDERMAAGVARNPQQNRFGRAFAYALVARDVGGDEARRLREAAVEDLRRTVEACAGVPMEPARFRPPEAATESAHPSCGNPATAPHNLEGTWFFAGEVLRESGDFARAADAFETAAAVAARTGWRFRPLAADRAAAMRRAVADPRAPTGPLAPAPVSCLLCHQR